MFPSANPDLYAHKSYFYLFNLEGSDSNPSGLSKASNKERHIFRADPMIIRIGRVI